jgi:hypothetical protein
LGVYGSADYRAKLAAAREGPKPDHGAMWGLIQRYRMSPEFAYLRDRTKLDYERGLRFVDDKFGDLKLIGVQSPKLTRFIYDWRDEKRDHPREANHRLTALKTVLSWSKKRGLINFDPAACVAKLPESDRRDFIWTGDNI